MARRTRVVDQELVQAAVRAIEDDLIAGRIGAEEARDRIVECRRSMTNRDLWNASAGRAGSPRRTGRADLRHAVIGVVGLLVMVAVGVWLVTWLLAQAPTG